MPTSSLVKNLSIVWCGTESRGANIPLPTAMEVVSLAMATPLRKSEGSEHSTVAYNIGVLFFASLFTMCGHMQYTQPWLATDNNITR